MLIRILFLSCLLCSACRKEDVAPEPAADSALAGEIPPTQDALPAAQDVTALDVAVDASEVTASVQD